MKATVLLALLLSPVLALAEEAAPASRFSNMEATFASGFYEPLRNAGLALNYAEDGSPKSLTLSVQGRKLTAWVWQTRPSRCGDRIFARLFVPNDHIATDIELADYSHIRCRLYAKHKWHATVETQEPDGSQSQLVLEGDPSN